MFTGSTWRSGRIAIAGDSTAASYDQKVYPGLQGWGQQLGRYVSSTTVIDNRALSGASSKSYQLMGRWDQLVANRPDYVLIQFGHNDLAGKGFGYETLPGPVTTPYPAYPTTGWRDEDWYRLNLTSMVEESRAAGAYPILITPMERLNWTSSGTIRRTNLPYATAAKWVAEQLDVPLIDLNSFSVATYGSLGDGASQAYHYVPPGGTLDRTHFSIAGAELYAEEIARQMRNIPAISQYVLVPEPTTCSTLAITAVLAASFRIRRKA